MADLGTLGSKYSEGLAVNNHGDVVGASITAGADTHAFVYTAGTGMQDLNWQIPISTGALLQTALAINDAGQIVSNGVNKTGQTHAFLLTPLHIGSITTLENGHVFLQGQTIPHGSVRIEASADLVTDFSLVETIMADETGAFAWEDLETATFNHRFYRAGLPTMGDQNNVSAVNAAATTGRKLGGNGFSRGKSKTNVLR